MRIARVAALTAALITTLAACGSDDEKSSSSLPDGVNNADISFVQMMIPHHEQATEMAELVEDRTDNPDVMRLADQIEAAQQPEIDLMSGWLAEWNIDATEGHSMDHGEGKSSMDGMMSDEDMADLKASSDAAFDQMWLSMMIEHHEGAISMAETEIERGSDPEVLDLAEQVVDTQAAEIDEMNGLLEQ